MGHEAEKVSIRRKSCQACHSRKVRCDHGEPCSACKRRNEDCVYPTKKVSEVCISKKLKPQPMVQFELLKAQQKSLLEIFDTADEYLVQDEALFSGIMYKFLDLNTACCPRPILPFDLVRRQSGSFYNPTSLSDAMISLGTFPSTEHLVNRETGRLIAKGHLRRCLVSLWQQMEDLNVYDAIALITIPEVLTEFLMGSTTVYRHLVKQIMETLIKQDQPAFQQKLLTNAAWSVLEINALFSVLFNRPSLSLDVDVPGMVSMADFYGFSESVSGMTRNTITQPTSGYVHTPLNSSLQQMFGVLMLLFDKINALKQHPLGSPEYEFEERCISFALEDWSQEFAKLSPIEDSLTAKVWIGFVEIAFWSFNLQLYLPKVTNQIRNMLPNNTRAMTTVRFAAKTIACAMRVLTIHRGIHFDRLPIFVVHALSNCALACITLLSSLDDPRSLLTVENDLHFILTLFGTQCPNWGMFSLFRRLLLEKVSEAGLDPEKFKGDTLQKEPMMNLFMF